MSFQLYSCFFFTKKCHSNMLAIISDAFICYLLAVLAFVVKKTLKREKLTAACFYTLDQRKLFGRYFLNIVWILVVQLLYTKKETKKYCTTTLSHSTLSLSLTHTLSLSSPLSFCLSIVYTSTSKL